MVGGHPAEAHTTQEISRGWEQASQGFLLALLSGLVPEFALYVWLMFDSVFLSFPASLFGHQWYREHLGKAFGAIFSKLTSKCIQEISSKIEVRELSVFSF